MVAVLRRGNVVDAVRNRTWYTVGRCCCICTYVGVGGKRLHHGHQKPRHLPVGLAIIDLRILLHETAPAGRRRMSNFGGDGDKALANVRGRASQRSAQHSIDDGEHRESGGHLLTT